MTQRWWPLLEPCCSIPRDTPRTGPRTSCAEWSRGPSPTKYKHPKTRHELRLPKNKIRSAGEQKQSLVVVNCIFCFHKSQHTEKVLVHGGQWIQPWSRTPQIACWSYQGVRTRRRSRCWTCHHMDKCWGTWNRMNSSNIMIAQKENRIVKCLLWDKINSRTPQFK